MFNLNLNGSTRSVDVSILNTSIESDAMMDEVQKMKEINERIDNSPIELTRKYYYGPNNLSSFSSNILSSLSTLPNASTQNLVHQLTTIVNELVIDTLLTNSTPTLLANFSNNDTLSDTKICINNDTQSECYEKDEFQKIIEEYIYPASYEFALIALHTIVFIVGLIGNALVCISVYRNHSMRNVVNYFIVNLAVADFLVILICLPPTVLWDVTETWWLGNTMCKTVYYFQSVSVVVSILTLTFISIDRWYAICHPLRFKCTTAKARVVIALIWFTSLIAMLPEAMDLHVEPPNFGQKLDLPYFTDCKSSWNASTMKIYQIMIVSFLYIIPFILMSVAYYQIAKVLWIRHIPGSAERSSPTANSGRRRSSSQINRSFRNLNASKNFLYTCLCYLCCRCIFKNCNIRRDRRRTDRQTKIISALNDNRDKKMSFELDESLKTGENLASPVSLQCTPLDTPSGTQSPTSQQYNATSPQSTINIDIEMNDRSKMNRKLNNVETENFSCIISAKKFEDQPLNQVSQKNIDKIDLNSLSNNLRSNLSSSIPSRIKNTYTNSNFTTKKTSLIGTTVIKLSRFKFFILRVLRLDSSSENKIQANGIPSTDNLNYERQGKAKTELTTSSNGRIEFSNSFQTTSFIRSISTRAKTIEEKNNRSSTPIQTLSSNHQGGSFRRLRRMTLPGNRLSKYISANRAESRVNCEGHIQSRRKAAKMLIAVVVMFGIFYLPLHIINILRYTIGLPQNDLTTVASLISHWLCYANSALNPIIYNVMSGKFRREFKNAFTCMCFRTKKTSSISRNSQHQTTKILNRQPVSNRIRANPQLIEQTSQKFSENSNVNGTYSHLLSSPKINKQCSAALLNDELTSQVEMPA